MDSPGATFFIERAGEGKCTFDYRAQVSSMDLATGQETWVTEVPWTADSPLAATNDRVIAVGANYPNPWASVAVMDLVDGRPQWQRDFDDPAGAIEPISVADSTVALIDGHDVVGLDLSSGDEEWRHEVGEQAIARPAGDAVVVARFDGSVTSFDLTSGAERWSARDSAGQGGQVGLLLTSDLAITGAQSGDLVALDVATGRELWARPSEAGRYWSPLLGAAGDVVVVGDGAGTDTDDPANYVTAISLSTGSVVWREPAADFPDQVVVLDDLVFDFGASQLVAREIATGSERWTSPLDQVSVVSGPEEGVVFATRRAQGQGSGVSLHALDTANGLERWSVDLPGTHGSAAVVAGDLVLVGGGRGESVVEGDGSADGLVSALNKHDGSVVWTVDRRDAVNDAPVVRGDEVLVVSADPSIFCD